MNLFIMLLHEFVKIVTALAPQTPSNPTARRITLRHASKVAIVISVQNGASGVAGSAISIQQSKNLAGLQEKALAFSTVLQCLDCDASDLFTEAVVLDGAFTTDSTANKQLLYLIEVAGSDLDANGGFGCLRLVVGDGANTTIAAWYALYPAIGADAEASAIAA